MALASSSPSLAYDPWMNSSFILYLGQPLEEYVISSHHVDSWFECGEKCLDNEDCVSFSHRTTSSDDINCIIASESDEIVIKNPHEVDTWTTYELRESISVSTCTAVFNLRINPTDRVHMHSQSGPEDCRSYRN